MTSIAEEEELGGEEEVGSTSSRVKLSGKSARKQAARGRKQKEGTDTQVKNPASGKSRGRNDRLPRSCMEGADLYVVRMAKKGLACAKPCWRWCLLPTHFFNLN